MIGEVTVVVQREDFAALAPEWGWLLDQGQVRSIFSTPEWQELNWRNLREDGWQLLLMAVRGKGRPIGIAPLRRRGGVIQFIGNPDVSDYLDFLFNPGHEELFYPAFLDALKSEDWNSLDLHCLPTASPTLTHLPFLAQRMGLTVVLEQENVSPGMELPGAWEDFLASLDKKHRHELRRKIRRLEQNDTFKYYALEGDGIAAGMDDFLRLQRASSPEKAAFMDLRMEAFFRDMLGRLAARDWVKLYFMEVDGKRVSTALCFKYGQEILLYNSGYDLSYGWLSVGLLLKAFCIRDAIETGMKRFDFLRGAEHYKYEMGGVDVPIYRCLVQRA